MRLIITIIVIGILLLFACQVFANAQPVTVHRGLLPGVWWYSAPAGPPLTVQPMVRYRICRPWWAQIPPVILYTSPPQTPSWGQYQGGWGIPPQQGNQPPAVDTK